jgi:hypothetical protein
MKLIDLREAIENSWSRETSYNPDKWTPDNPALGQCAITTLFLHRQSGGNVMRGNVLTPNNENIIHYWLRIGGIDIDFTWKQFPNGSKITKEETIDPRRIERDPTTMSRYSIFYTNVISYVKNNIITTYLNYLK